MFALVFDRGDDPQQGLQTFAIDSGIWAASLTAIGAFEQATLAYFDPDQMDYIDIPVQEQVEVLLEVIATETPSHLHKIHDPATGLTLSNSQATRPEASETPLLPRSI